jgi:hypothetical protein
MLDATSTRHESCHCAHENLSAIEWFGPVAKKKAEPKLAAPLSRVRFIKAPVPEKAPEPPEPEWDERVLAAWAKTMAKLVPNESEEARRERARRRRAVLTAKPPQLQSREKNWPQRTDEPAFHGLKPRVQLAVLALDELQDKGVALFGMPKPRLAELVATQASATVSVRTLFTAEKYRQEHPRR